MPSFWHDLIRAVLAPACRLSRKPRRADLLLAASPARRLLTGFLCTSMWITCAKRHQACARAVEMLGIPAPGHAHERALNWENATRTLCMQKEPELSTRHAAKAHK